MITFRDKYGKDLTLTSAGIGDETYGKRSFVYVYNCQRSFGVDRAQVIKDLVAADFQKPGNWGALSDYEKVGQGLEIRVSYFKGQNWNE